MQDDASGIELDDTDRQHVSDALKSILATDRFEASPQMSAFLRYVVEQSIEGNQSRIKAFTVAVDALGKPSSFDPQNDPVVRVMAGRLRAALSVYNEENPGSPVMITMTKGSYVPIFRWREKPSSNATATGQNPHTDAAIAPRSSSVSQLPPAHEFPPPAESAMTSSSDAPTVNAETLTEGEHHAKPEKLAPESTKPPFSRHATAIPRLAVIAIVIAVVAVSYVVNDSAENSAQQMQAAAPTKSIAIRSRPKSPSVFVSAIDRGDPLQNGLNTVVSGVISENADVSVYRILGQEPELDFWPEDYILSLTSLNLPDETRVDLQLMEAQTGRIVHSQAVSLKEQSSEQLSQDELTELIEATQSIVMEQGPLFMHYTNKRTQRH